MSPHCSSTYSWREPRSFSPCVREPALEQLLQDPLIRLVMKSDGVAEADIRALVRPARGEGLARA